ncbi:hypothetical protein LCGC14_1321840 [marine sediment metagenome]|uniref:VRR-NUC domain-containing protein n=1 Tax=marine sediment metagenome TaxID=412755 RepID=A0A0F9KJT0_9ZZZZ
MKRQTRARQYIDLANAVKQINSGKKVKRVGARDGSITTHPIVSVDIHKPEKIVLKECLEWLKSYHVFCNRHDAGTFQNDRGQWGAYGIKGSGDIHGVLKRHGGKHFEIECKRGSGGRLSLDQQKRMRNVVANDSLYFIVHGVEELAHFMRGYV